MGERRHPNVVNLDEVEGMERSTGSRFGARAKTLGFATGGAGIGCNWFEVPPGRTAMPRHWHGANEEVIFVLAGEGSLRIGDDTVAVRAGDYITFPVGPEHAHQLLNTGEGPLQYLCVSTKLGTDVVGYPDSGKIAAMTGPPDAWHTRSFWAANWWREGDAVSYFEGEEID